MNPRQRELRLEALELISRMGEGSSGRMLSSIDLIEGLFFGEENGRQIFKHNPKLPQWEERDYFVLSKIEALPALHAVLQKDGYTLPEVLPFFPNRKVPGVEVTTEEHAYGLCMAVGMAQAIMVAAERKLDRLCLILDENSPNDVLWQERFESFGWKVVKLRDAHDHDEIVYGYMKARLTLRKPTCIWAPTKKSAGVPFAERKPEYDDVVFSEAELQEIRTLLL